MASYNYTLKKIRWCMIVKFVCRQRSQENKWNCFKGIYRCRTICAASLPVHFLTLSNLASPTSTETAPQTSLVTFQLPSPMGAFWTSAYWINLS